MEDTNYSTRIPISPILEDIERTEPNGKNEFLEKKRLIYICALSVIIAVAISIIARLLIYLIDLVSNISFFGVVSVDFYSPSDNQLGVWSIGIPVIGGLLVGLMAFYGSKAIRGHGIPEAMEQILVNQSRIKPSITFLKPLSSAIAIGTGGPFGAEGPIIATGGALGSTLGQLVKITSNERKIILAAGATAGMSAIFGTPIAAVFLAIELLLFEFSPKSILPVALACITGAAGHHLLFDAGPVFPMPDLAIPSNFALGIYSIIGVLIGFLSLALTKIVYFIEDLFEKLPVHWMWWPAIGGLAVGVIGYFAPRTLGVGYNNIIDVLSGNMALGLIFSLCFFKFLSWAIALGSGTSGGTLAPLLTIGGAAGAIAGTLLIHLIPNSEINIPMAALVGMSAMFAGASRAYLTSITFALESTMQSHALLPLLGACTASYLVSFFFMENTIMTEKIARRGVYTPDSYEPDILKKLTVAQVLKHKATVLSSETPIKEVKDFLQKAKETATHFIVVNKHGLFQGMVDLIDIYKQHDSALPISTLVQKTSFTVRINDNLGDVVDLMAQGNEEIVPVVSPSEDHAIVGVLTSKDIMSAYKYRLRENQEAVTNLSIKRQRIKVLIRGRKLINMTRG